MTLERLRARLGNELPPYKLPTKMILTQEIIKNPMGKINKKDLIGLFET